MLTLAQKKSLLQLARQALAELWNDKKAALKNTAGLQELSSRFAGVFVSLHVNEKLRGCIGNLNASSALPELIVEMAQAAATHDPRFEPLAAEELPALEIEISLLHSMTPMRSPDEIEIGREGLLVRRGHKHGLLLPQVADKREWDAIMFLEQTCRKADLPLAAWKDSETEVLRFRAEVFSDRSWADL